MNSQKKPDMLHVSQRSDGSLIAVGLPWTAGVLVQEYWFQRLPHYAIANVSDEAIEVALVEWNGAAGQRLMESWTVAPHTVQCYEIQDLITSYKGSLIAVSVNKIPVYGLLKAPQPFSDLIDWNTVEEVVTIDGLNGIGGNTNLCCLQEQLVFDSGQSISLTIRVPENTGTLFFEETDLSKDLLQGNVIGATSDTLSVETQGESFIIGAQKTARADFHQVTLTVKIPKIDTKTMVTIFGRVAALGGGGFSFGRGLIVRAEH